MHQHVVSRHPVGKPAGLAGTPSSYLIYANTMYSAAKRGRSYDVPVETLYGAGTGNVLRVEIHHPFDA